MKGWNFSGQNLTNAVFETSDLTDADFSNAVVVGTDFLGSTLTADQLYSTAGYKAKDLRGIGLGCLKFTWGKFAGQNLQHADLQQGNFSAADFSGANLQEACLYETNLTGADLGRAKLQRAFFHNADLTNARLAGANLECAALISTSLTNADFSGANLMHVECWGSTLSGANLTGADARKASNFDITGATITNLIRPDGTVHGLDLTGGGKLVVCNYIYNTNDADDIVPIAVHVQNAMAMDASGVLDLVFDENAWNSTISFDAGIDVTLGGILKLEFEDGTDISSLVGTTFHVFDWTGVKPEGKFNVESDYAWNLDALYTTGEITLVPEPSGVVLAVLGTVAAIFWRRMRDEG